MRSFILAAFTLALGLGLPAFGHCLKDFKNTTLNDVIEMIDYSDCSTAELSYMDETLSNYLSVQKKTAPRVLSHSQRAHLLQVKSSLAVIRTQALR